MGTWKYKERWESLVRVAFISLLLSSVCFGVRQGWSENVANFSHDPARAEKRGFSESSLDVFIGPKDAPIPLVEFSDFQCPFCARVKPMLNQLLRQYPNQIKVVFKHFPLSFHPDAPLAHEAALAAGEQGKFWEMHDLLFASQSRLKREDLIGYGEELRLDMDVSHQHYNSRGHHVC